MNSVVQIFVPNPSDLIITALSIPSSVNLGDNVSVVYNIKNIGANEAIGELTNAVYFFRRHPFNALTDYLLNTEQSYIAIQPGDSIVRSITSLMPGVIPGEYYGIGRTNILNTIVESNINNNTFITDSTMLVTVQSLYLDTPVTFRLDIGNQVYYKVNVRSNLDLIITLTSNQSYGSNEVYVAYNRVPSTNDFDYLFQNPGQVNQTVLVPSTQPGNYYILVRTPTNYYGLQQATLLARAIPFSIISLAPDTVGNGIVTTQIDGGGFRNYTKFYLLSQDSAIIDTAINISLANSMQAAVTWDFTKLIGIYHVMAVNNDTTKFIRPNAITIVQSTGYQVNFSYDAPSLIRMNGNASFPSITPIPRNVNIPFIKGDYTIPTYTNVLNMGTVGNVMLRSQLIVDPSLGPLKNWIDYDGYRFIPFIAKNLAPGQSFTVDVMFAGFGNSAIFPLRARAYGFSTDGFIMNQLNMAEGARENMQTNPDVFSVLNQNPSVMNLLTNPVVWRDSILNFYMASGLLTSSDTTDFLSTCVACNTGFSASVTNSNSSTYDPGNGNSPRTATYIATAFSSGEDYTWTINNYNGKAGTSPG